MPLLFALTLFISAFLLFLVQPMVGKMVLPLLGGTPAVWNTCMVFFQAMLLAGYAYAHATTRLGIRRQAILHLFILLLPLAMLPVGLHSTGDPPGDASPIPWLLMTLTVAVGLPFFVVATSGPLLQQWFAGTGHPSARDPYFLYAASNLGSLLALVAYPAVVEPRWALPEQGWWWAWGYGALVGLTMLCAVVTRYAHRPEAPAREEENPSPALRAGEESFSRLRWVFLAFVPSSLLLGVTTYLTTDIAAVPLLWVVPLALYLLTFILAFARRRLGSRRIAAAALPVFALCLTLALLASATEPAWLLVPLHLVTFFVAALVCHGELARARPPAERLTEYYLWVAFGGVLGGLFNALLAPVVFRTTGLVEYPLAMLLACAAIPSARPVGCRGLVKPVVLGLFTVGLAVIGRVLFPQPGKLAMAVLFGVPVLLCAPLMDQPRRFALGLGLILLAGSLHPGPHGATLFYERNFFGVVRVTAEPGTGWHRMVHGNTEHGRQAWEDGRSLPEPLGYYHRRGPAGSIFEAANAKPARSVAICGLGAGALAYYARPGQRWDFYEIDPAVARVAQDPSLFTYLRDCQAPYQIVLGDARLRLREAEKTYHLIVIDCFSSDAIPVHLLTREALAVYRSKLAAGGLLAFHVSNRYLDLQPVLAVLARDAGLAECRSREDLSVDEEEARAGRSPSIWVVLAERTGDLGTLVRRFSPITMPMAGVPVWTDGYSNVLSVFRWNWGD